MTDAQLLDLICDQPEVFLKLVSIGLERDRTAAMRLMLRYCAYQGTKTAPVQAQPN